MKKDHGARGPAADALERERERVYAAVRAKLPKRRLEQACAVNIAVLVGLIAFFFLAALFFPKPTFSEVEKRDLAVMPAFSVKALFGGTYTRGIETFYADTFPLREQFVAFASVLEEARGARLDNVRIVAPTGGEAQDLPAPSGPPAPQSAKPPEENVSGAQSVASGPPPSSQEAAQPVDDGAVGPINNGTFVYNGMAMSLFGGGDEMAKWYADVVSAYQRELPQVQVYDMIIPTAIEFYVPDKYRNLTNSQKDTMDLIYRSVDPRVRTVDAYGAISKHTDEYLYFRTDHHWTGLAAYYAYTAFCESAGLVPVKLEDCETRRLPDFIGTLYAQSGQDSTLLKNPDYVDYYIFPREYEQVLRYDRNAPYQGNPHTLLAEYAAGPNSYSVFLAGDYPLISIRTDLRNGRKALVVKESFGNAFAPFLVNNYEEVHVVDQRYFQLSLVDYIKSHGINDLIFANNSFAACTPYHIRCIDNMRHQVFVPYVPPAPAEPAASEPEAPSPEEAPSEEEKPAPKKVKKSAVDEEPEEGGPLIKSKKGRSRDDE